MLERLREPFEYDEIEWRVSRVFNDKAVVLAYIQSRAVMDRLDDVFGPGGWQDDYEYTEAGFICRLKVIFETGEWITKTDGAPQTNIEAFKGGISDALKRAAVKFGIGRYLYKLTETWVDLHKVKPKGDPRHIHYAKDKLGNGCYWVSPSLPEWALPKGSKAPKPVATLQENNKQAVDNFVKEKNSKWLCTRDDLERNLDTWLLINDTEMKKKDDAKECWKVNSELIMSGDAEWANEIRGMFAKKIEALPEVFNEA